MNYCCKVRHNKRIQRHLKCVNRHCCPDYNYVTNINIICKSDTYIVWVSEKICIIQKENDYANNHDNHVQSNLLEVPSIQTVILQLLQTYRCHHQILKALCMDQRSDAVWKWNKWTTYNGIKYQGWGQRHIYISRYLFGRIFLPPLMILLPSSWQDSTNNHEMTQVNWSY